MFRAAHLPPAALDPIQLLSAITMATMHIGLVATVSTTYTQPWETARGLATLDFLSHGRASWNIVTTRVTARRRCSRAGRVAQKRRCGAVAASWWRRRRG